jgi:hypothetical protein
MRYQTKHILVPAGCATAFILYLALLAVLLAPHIVRLDAVETRIRESVRQACACSFDFRSLEFSALPLPEFSLREVRFSIPKKIRAKIRTVSIQPSVADLFLGRLQIGNIEMDRPRITMYPGRHKPPPFLHPDYLRRKIRSGALDVEVGVSGGSLQILPPNGERYTVRDLSVSLALSRSSSLRMECSSSLWERLSISARGNVEDLGLQGTMRLQRLTPGDLAAHLPLPEPWELAETCLNLRADFRIKGSGHIEADLEGSVPRCLVCRDEQSSALEVSTFEASLRRGDGYTRIVLDRLELASPGAEMQARVLMTEDPAITDLKLTCSNLDLSSFRACSGTLLADNPVLDQIFRVLREGGIPSLAIASHGSTPAQFAENLLVRAAIEDARVFVPELETEFSRVSAEVLVANKILRATEMRGQLGELRARKGSLRFGLTDSADTTFSLQLVFEGGVRPVPDILRKTLRSETAGRQLRPLKRLEGNVSGTFMLTDSLQGMRLHTRVQDFKLQADYASLPAPLTAQGEELSISTEAVRLRDSRITLGTSSAQGVSAGLDLEGSVLRLKAGRAEIRLDEVFSWLRSRQEQFPQLSRVTSLQGAVILRDLTMSGPTGAPREWEVDCSGALRSVGLGLQPLPEPVRLDSGSFRVREGAIPFNGVRAGLLDSSVQLSGELRGYRGAGAEADTGFRGRIGPRTVRYCSEALGLPASWLLQAPLALREGSLRWKPGSIEEFSSTVSSPGGTSVRCSGSWSPDGLRLEECTINGREETAILSARITRGSLNVDFQGDLSASTLDGLLAAENPLLRGSLSGDFQAGFSLDPLYLTSVQGELQLRKARLPVPGPEKATITRLGMQAGADELKLPSFSLEWREHRIRGRGRVEINDTGNVFDVRILTEHLKWSTIRQALDEASRRSEGNGPAVRLSGSLNVITDAFFYRDLIFAPFKANIQVNPDHTARIEIQEAGLCSVPAQGTMEIAPKAFSLDMSVTASDQQLKPFLSCLRGGERIISGTFDLKGRISAEAEKPDNISEKIRGNVRMRARDGRIYRFNVLAKIMALLNSTEIFFGQTPELEKEGMGYHSIALEGGIEKGVLKLEKMLIDGHSMEIAFRGDIRLHNSTVDMIVLVAPLKTMDRLVKKIPLVRTIMGGNLVSIPFRVRGPAADPTVVPLSPKAVGSELLGYMKRTLKLPFTLFQPLFPEGGAKLVPGSGDGNATGKEDTRAGEVDTSR